MAGMMGSHLSHEKGWGTEWKKSQWVTYQSQGDREPILPGTRISEQFSLQLMGARKVPYHSVTSGLHVDAVHVGDCLFDSAVAAPSSMARWALGM